MSIYSGFATRNQENYYDQILYNLISTLLVRISKFYRGDDVDQNSFLKIITNQERVLKKLEKRKYLEPKYAELLETFINQVKSGYFPVEKTGGRNLHRTLSVLDREFHELRNANQKVITQDQGQQRDAHSLMKIDERIKKPKKKSKSNKKNSIATIKSHLDVWQFKNEKKMPELPALQPQNIEQNLLTYTKFNSKINFSQANSREMSEAEEFSVNQKPQYNNKILSRPPKFRAKMYYKES